MSLSTWETALTLSDSDAPIRVAVHAHDYMSFRTGDQKLPCREGEKGDTIHQPAIQACSKSPFINDCPNTPMALLAQYPYPHVQRRPHTQDRYDMRRVFVVTMPAKNWFLVAR